MPGIGVCTPIPDPTDKAKDVIVDASRSFFSDIVDWVLRGYIWITKYLWKLFIGVNVDASGSTSTAQRVTDMTGQLQVVAAGVGLLVALIQIICQRMLLTGDDDAPEAFAGFLRWALAASLAAPALLSLSAASDALAQWIFTSSAGPEGPTHVVDTLSAALSGRDARLKTEDVIALALCLLGLIAYLELAIQLFLQKAWLIYVAAALPIAGAASVTGAGKAVFYSMLRLGIAALLFKPIVALLFAVGFWQIRELGSGDDIVTAVLVMAAPAFCMPVLVQLIGGASVSGSGAPLLRRTVRAHRSGKGIVGSALSDIADGWRQGRGRADQKDAAASASRAEARATNPPSQPAAAGTTANRSSSTNRATTSPGQAPTSNTSASANNRTSASAAGTSASGTRHGTATGSPGTRATGTGSSSAGTGTQGSTNPRAGNTAAGGGNTSRSVPRGAGGGTGSAPSGTRPSAAASNRAGGRSSNAAASPASSSAPPQTPPRRRATRSAGPPTDTLNRID